MARTELSFSQSGGNLDQCARMSGSECIKFVTDLLVTTTSPRPEDLHSALQVAAQVAKMLEMRGDARCAESIRELAELTVSPGGIKARS